MATQDEQNKYQTIFAAADLAIDVLLRNGSLEDATEAMIGKLKDVNNLLPDDIAEGFSSPLADMGIQMMASSDMDEKNFLSDLIGKVVSVMNDAEKIIAGIEYHSLAGDLACRNGRRNQSSPYVRTRCRQIAVCLGHPLPWPGAVPGAYPAQALAENQPYL